MCDTLVATGEATAGGASLLAKNSDRFPNEAHVVEYLPPAQHEPGSTVRCTYVSVPQVPQTHGLLLCKPFWIWGCEMGVSDCGAAIGNEAVFTKEPYDKAPGLLGMDMARLALEREAAELSATYVQGSAEDRAAPLAAFTASCFARAKEATAHWRDRVRAAPVTHRPGRLFSLAWNRFGKQAGFQQEG